MPTDPTIIEVLIPTPYGASHTHAISDIVGLAEALSEAGDDASALAGRATALEGRATALEGRATALEGRATALETDVSTLEGRATTTEGDVTALQGRATALEGRATTVEGRATALEGRATAVEGRATTLEGRATALEGRALALENRATGTEDSISGIPKMLSTFPDILGSDYIGTMVGDQFLYGVDVEDEGKFLGKRIAADSSESYPQCPDYLGFGWRHYRITKGGHVVGYTDLDGIDWRWTGSSYTAGLAPYSGELGSEYVGVINNEQLLYGADTADENKFFGHRISAKTAEGFPIIPDYLGFGWQHYQLSGDDHLIGYTDGDGVNWRWNGERYSSDGANAEMVGSPASDARGIVIEEIMRHAAYVASPPTLPSDAHLPQTISVDTEAYYPYVSRQIPAVEQIGQRLFRACYGLNNVEPGQSGEVIPCYVTVEFSDERGAEGSWQTAFFIVPNNENIGIGDQHFCATHDGKLILTYLVQGSGKKRSNYGLLIKNPETGTALNFDVGPQCFLGYGFGGRPRMFGTDILHTCSEPTREMAGPYEFYQGNKLQRIRVYGDVLVPEYISHIPNAQPEEELNDFYECAIAPFGENGIFAIFRTEEHQYTSRSYDRGKHWTPAEKFTAYPTSSSRVDMARSPTGRLVLVFNHSDVGARGNMAIAMTDPGGDGTKWPYMFIFDPRGMTGNPRVSYPSIAFGLDENYAYDGQIIAGYDNGRNRDTDPPTDGGGYYGALITAVIPEESVVSGTPTVELFFDHTPDPVITD